ncbi:MAG TPA: methyltransferase [Noviherbaspirillum sp.]|jgi:hypothetical protein|uniref:methyltransferase n=1 Tax=Noviherbaspirillum sp. TaxID=1926288 RepID=UPI002F939C3A
MSNRYPWLCIEAFLADFTGARALSSAFELGLVDLLVAGPQSPAQLGAALPLDARGLHLLLAMLRAHNVLEETATAEGCAVALSSGFTEALAFRDLLEARLYFAQLVGPDFLHLATALFAEPDAFFRRARLFELFSYDRCFERSQANLDATARWMRITTALTSYEALACIDAFDFSRYRRQLDVGGNSGEFLLRICRAHPALRGTVLDLPLVCEIGAAHVAGEPEAARIAFQKTRSRDELLPAGHDLISFKSMLHDWPDADMHRFLTRAHAALPDGGSILIFERARMEQLPQPLSWGQLPLLLFFRSYRDAGDYERALARAGFRDITLQSVQLETPFHLISARK